LALAIPSGGFLYLISTGSQSANPPAVGVMVGLGVLWLATVLRLNALPVDRGTRSVRNVRDVGPDRAPVPRAMTPAYVVDVRLPVKPWRWTSVLLAPLELLAVAWSVPVVILLIMLPIGLALVSALWLGRLILHLF
jgi:hypothetical protein